MTRTIFIAAALAFVATLSAAPANAQVNRTYVSAAGSDSNNCANVATPCRHFQTAVNATAAGGEVVALDPANYGSITIGQAITIEGQGWSYVAPPNNGNGITINAVSGNVTIRGVLLNGDGATGGTNGIVLNSGGSLTVTNCVVQNFAYSGSGVNTGNGILMQPTSGTIKFIITNTNVSNNGNVGILYDPPSGSATADGVIDRVEATNNAIGIGIITQSGGGPTTVAVSNDIANNNSGAGISVGNASTTFTVSIDNTSMSGNRNGLVAGSLSGSSFAVLLGRSVITANSNEGISNGTTPSSIYSYQDNRINGNGTGSADDVVGLALNSYAPK
jgi:hypothetical protein